MPIQVCEELVGPAIDMLSNVKADLEATMYSITNFYYSGTTDDEYKDLYD